MKVEIRGDYVVVIETMNIDKGYDVERIIPVMTKEVFVECYNKWIKGERE